LSERELARLGTAIRKVETESRTGACAIAAIRLLILTGARKPGTTRQRVVLRIST